MKKKNIPVQQYSFETVNTSGAADDFLDKTAPLIGYIVHSFNALEELLNSEICQLINERTDAPGLVVIQRLNYSPKVDLFKRYILMEETYFKTGTAKIDKLIENLIKSGTYRNQVVHADWESAFEDGYTRCKLIINTHGVQHEYIQFTLESLEKIKELIDETYNMFSEYKDK